MCGKVEKILEREKKNCQKEKEKNGREILLNVNE